MTTPTVTAYTFFDVAPDCSQAALRQAYDAAVARHHPDKAWSTPTAAASKTGMQEVHRWWALVATEEARAAYDRTLQAQKQKQKQEKQKSKTDDTPGDPSAKPTRPRPRRKPVNSRPTQQLVLSRPPLLRPVALFCALVVAVAQAVAVAASWTRRQAVAALRRRQRRRRLRRALLRGAAVLTAATVAACLLVGWPAGATGLGPCVPPPPFAAYRHYRQLGLADGGPATPFADIRKAYHQAIRVHHPDKKQKKQQQQQQSRWWPSSLQQVCWTGHAGRLAAIAEAYQVLRDPQTRCVYDAQQQRRQRLWLWPAAAARDCGRARWESAWNEAPVLSTAKDAVVLWRAGQAAVFQTVQSLWASVWASLRGVARRVAAMVGR